MKKTIITTATIFVSLFSLLNINTAEAFWLFNKNSSTASASTSTSISQQARVFSQKDSKLRTEVVKLALQAYSNAQQKGVHIKKPIITIIDYSLASNIKRLWVLDLQRQSILFNSLVAHGKYTGDSRAYNFSDKMGSQQSSLGLFLTEEPYIGHRGYTLRIAGLENGFNSHAEERRIVIHGAWYASEEVARSHGQIGRSWGCPAVEPQMAEPIINTIKNGSLVFSYYPDKNWLNNSRFINYQA